MREPKPAAPGVLIQSLLVRVEEATGPDRELDGALLALAKGWRFTAIECGQFHFGLNQWVRASDVPRYTISLDAALALVERCLPQRGVCAHAVDMIETAMNDMLERGWRPNEPLAPQLARYVLAALLRALIEQKTQDSEAIREAVAGTETQDEPIK